MRGDRDSRLVVHDHYVVAFQENPELRRCDIHAEMLWDVWLPARMADASGEWIGLFVTLSIRGSG
jgi:hypothetical protein